MPEILAWRTNGGEGANRRFSCRTDTIVAMDFSVGLEIVIFLRLAAACSRSGQWKHQFWAL